MSYSYFADGSLKTRTDARGIVTSIAYDFLNRPLSKAYSGDDTSGAGYSYDKLRLTAVSTGGVVSRAFTYTPGGRIATSTQTTGGVSYPFTYAYYMDGSVASVQYPSGRTVSYPDADRAGRLTKVAGTLGGVSKTYVSAMTYNEQGLMAATVLGNGLTERWSYNAQRLQPYDVRLGTAGNEMSHLTLQFAYCANQYSGGSCATNNGNIVAQWNYANYHIEHYGYDAVNRLTSATDYTAAPNGWSQGYSYDRYGNRWVSANDTLPVDPRTPTSSSYINAANNRLTGANYGYDAAGNQTAYGGWTLAYDAENRLVSSEPSSGNTTTYDYDGEGRRVKKTTNGVSTVYVYGADGELAAEYGGPAQTAGTRYITTDHLGSTRLVTDASGNVVSRHDYLPFGEEIPAGIGGRTTGMGYVANPAVAQKFTGKERDAETGLDYFGARYLSGVLGRFSSADPIWIKADRLADPQRLNLYTYGRNNPLRFTDPTGMDITIGKCSIGAAEDCYNRMLQGIRKEDRSHVRLVQGDGKNGFKRGQSGVVVDKDYKSTSKNFQALQTLANDHSAVAEVSVVAPKEQISGNAGVKDPSGQVVLKTFKESYGMNLTLEQGWFGQTLYQNWGGPAVDGATYSARDLTEVYVGTDQTVNSMIETMHHELRHVFLADFGRAVPKGQHGTPGVNQSTTQAEKEAGLNLGQR